MLFVLQTRTQQVALSDRSSLQVIVFFYNRAAKRQAKEPDDSAGRTHVPSAPAVFRAMFPGRRFLSPLLLAVTMLAVSGQRLGAQVGQAGLESLDGALAMPDGIYSGRLSHAPAPEGRAHLLPADSSLALRPEARVRIYLFRAWKRVRDLRFEFRDLRHQPVVTLLYLDGGREIWLRDFRRNELHRKDGLLRFESLLGTAFSFEDLRPERYEARYDGAAARSLPDNRIELRARAFPDSEYGNLIFISRAGPDWQAERVDFLNREGILFKTLLYGYTGRIAAASAGIAAVGYPTLLEMMDLRHEAVSRLEWAGADTTRSIDAGLFDPDTL